MIVDCPRCRARYRVEEEVLADDPTFKCSRCNHVFVFEWRGDEEIEIVTSGRGLDPQGSIEVDPDARQTSPEKELDLPADEPAPPAAAPARSRSSSREAESLSFDFSAGGGARSGSVRASTRRVEDEEESYIFDLDEDPDMSDRAQGNEPEDVDEEPRFVRGEDELRVEEEGGEGSPGRAYMLFLGILVMGYAVVALDLRGHPARAQSLLGSFPLVGRMLTEDHLLQTRIHLEDVAGAYQLIKEDKLVFVLSGRAVNTSGQPLKSVQIEGALYGKDGETLERKGIFCGNAMSLKLVRDLSTSEISLLQGLEPPKRFEIRPGESAAFTIAFVNPPAGLKEFGARVLTAQANGS